MKLAYFIMAHKNPNQVRRLVETIYTPQHYYLIHFDQKSPSDCHELAKELAATYPNIYHMPSMYCWWGGFSLSDLVFRSIQQLLTIAQDWQMFINISGQDFPLCSQEEIVAYLSDKQEHNFIEVFDPTKVWLDEGPRNHRVGLELPFRPGILEIPRLRINRDFLIGNVPVYGGAAWFIFSYAFCKYLVQAKEVTKYRYFFKHVPHSAENFFQTVIMNSDFRHTIINDYKRQINWSEGNANPKIYTVHDYEELVQSSAFFARKFDERVDAEIIRRLESKVRQPSLVTTRV